MKTKRYLHRNAHAGSRIRKILSAGVLFFVLTAFAACGSDKVYTLEDLTGAETETTGAPNAQPAPEAQASEESPTGTAPSAAADATGSDTAGSGTAEPGTITVPSDPPATLKVFVCGAVADSKVVTLPVGSRVQDALLAAGGFTEEADTDYVTLARELTDGERLSFPTLEETEELRKGGSTSLSTPQYGGSAAATGTTAVSPVNLNTADSAQLCTLPGIGPSKAAAILQYRAEHGGFQSPEELKQVSGIGDSSYAKLKDYVYVR